MSRGDALRSHGYPKPVRDLVAIMVGAILVHLAVHVFTLTLELAAWSRGADGVRDGFSELWSAYRASFFVFFVAAPIGCITWFHWLDRSIKNLYADGIEKFERTPFDVVMAYFVPLLNLYKPLFDLQRIYCAVRAGNAWHRIRSVPILTLWWVVSLTQLLLMGIELALGFSWVTVVSSVVSLATALLALFVLRAFAMVQPHWLSASARQELIDTAARQTRKVRHGCENQRLAQDCSI